MKINLNAVKNTQFSTKRSPLSISPSKIKPLDQNVISVFSNSIHYKIVRE